MKKRVARLQRWLDRLLAACESRRWDAAVAEADCLSAELKEIRGDLWKLAAEEETSPRRLFTLDGLTEGFRIAAIAFVIVMASTLPISVEAEKSLSSAGNTAKIEKDYVHLSWVTQDEEDVLHVLRSDLSASTPPAVMAAKPAYARTKKVASPTVQTVATKPEKQRPAVKTQLNNREPVIAQEILLALIQVGEKALRGGEPAVRVIK